MNTPRPMDPVNALPQAATSQPNPRLLDRIRAVRASVGEGLNDEELTCLLRQTPLPTEAGFAFLSYSNGCVTLTVPPQDPARWYPDTGWIAEAKERLASALAEKYELFLSEPPDRNADAVFPGFEARAVPHHLELTDELETVVVAHPLYLKVRLFGAARTGRYRWQGFVALRFGPDLLQDLAGLYRS